MITSVKFFAEEDLVKLPGDPRVGVISIVTPPYESDIEFGFRFAELQDGWHSILRLWFHDLSRPWQNYILFDNELADQVIDWLVQHSRNMSAVYIHCAAGESRSAGVARFLSKIYKLDFDHVAGRGFNPLVYRTLIRRWYQRRLPRRR